MKPNQPNEKNRLSAFGQRIAELRQAASLTMTGLAERIGVSEAYVSMLESGGRRPSRKVIEKLVLVFQSDTTPLLRDQLLVLAQHDPLSEAKSPQHTHYEKLLAQTPSDSFPTFMALVNSLIRQGQHALAQTRIEAGFKSFQQTAQLQMLVAYLELSRANHDAGIVAMEAAIQFKQRNPDTEQTSLAELLLNLGVLHFFKGSARLAAMHEATHSLDPQQAAQRRAEALECFSQARRMYADGLDLEPGHITLLDEYARVCFNLAELHSDLAARPYWDESILSFEKVLNSPVKDTLEEDTLLESSCFLAHAFTKAGRYQQARQTLAVITACQPRYAFGYYVLACHYALQACTHALTVRESDNKPGKNSKAASADVAALDQSLFYLAKAIGLKPGLKAQAWLEPDLLSLHRHRPEAIKELLT